MRIKSINQLPPLLQAQVLKQLNADIQSSPVKKPTKKSQNSEINPQQMLYQLVHDQWPHCVAEFIPPELEHRKFRLDIAFVNEKLAIEFDGWQYHGKFKSGFQRDRIKQNLLTVNGWRTLRFFYSQITNQSAQKDIINMIEKALQQSH